MPKLLLNTVVTTRTFDRDVRRFLSEDELADLIDFLAENPTSGDVIPGTGGIRKLRWGAQGKGKRGGARIIHFYHNGEMPLFLLAVYAKNTKLDLTAAEKRALTKLTAALKKEYAR